MPLLAPISVGELLDKLSILELKETAITDPAKRANVQRELRALSERRQRFIPPLPQLDALYRELQDVNRRLWHIENQLRAHERAGRFDHVFIALARSVYRENDRRSALKYQINRLTESEIVEEKYYVDPDSTCE